MSLFLPTPHNHGISKYILGSIQVMRSVVTTRLGYQVSSRINGSRLEIYDMTGRNLYKAEAREGIQYINVSGWSAGKYLIRLITINAAVYSHQFIKQ